MVTMDIGAGSPEQDDEVHGQLGGSPNEQVDLWGLAVVLLHASGGTDPAFTAFFRRALALRPEDRFASAAAMREALSDIAE